MCSGNETQYDLCYDPLTTQEGPVLKILKRLSLVPMTLETLQVKSYFTSLIPKILTSLIPKILSS